MGQLSFPCVLKIPDGSFSRGVIKVKNVDEYVAQATKMLENSFIILAQEYLYTEFDWRIGVLDGRPLFACKYHMAKGHWQIYNHRAGGRTSAGGFETMAVEDAPPAVIKAAVKASLQMGHGLYGVDIKEARGIAHVIEVNDNPNIDAGIEDKFIGERMYDEVISVFRRRILIARGLAGVGRRKAGMKKGAAAMCSRALCLKLRYFIASVISEVQAPVGSLVMIFWSSSALAVRS